MQRARLSPQDIASDARRQKMRDMYDDGWSLNALKRRFHLTDGEAHDLAPEESEPWRAPGGNAGY